VIFKVWHKRRAIFTSVQYDFTRFITFMLHCLKQALEEMRESNQKSNQKIISAMQTNPMVTIRELQEITGLSESSVKKIIRQI